MNTTDERYFRVTIYPEGTKVIDRSLVDRTLKAAHEEIDCNPEKSGMLFNVFVTGAERILADAFAGNHDIAEVHLFSSLQDIGDRAFHGCSSLQKVEFVEFMDSEKWELKTIGFDAFAHCEALREIDIPASVTLIKPRAFYGCKHLVKADLSPNLTVLTDELFADCNRLREVVLPLRSGITEIGESIFANCWDLRSVELPHTAKFLGQEAFYGCHQLRHIELPESLEAIRSGTFSQCWSLESVVIPARVCHLAETAFYGCQQLRFVELPSDLEEVPIGAFANCPRLRMIYCRSVKTQVPDDAVLGAKAIVSHAGMVDGWVPHEE